MAPANKKLEGIGYTALGLGFFFQAAKAFGLFGGGDAVVPGKMDGSRAKLAGLGNAEGAALQRGRVAGIIEKSTIRTVGDIKDRVSYIQDRIRKDSLKPEVREMALSVLTRRCYEDGDEVPEGAIRQPGGPGRKVVWCVPEKDYEAEITALYRAMQDPGSPLALRYTRDHNKVDQYHAANKLASLHGPALSGGDCDDGTILLGAMLHSVGYPVRMRVIQDVNSPSWSHIYLLCGTPPMNARKWIPLDWSVKPNKPPGWEAPGAKEVAKTGKPHGVVVKLMDFTV